MWAIEFTALLLRCCGRCACAFTGSLFGATHSKYGGAYPGYLRIILRGASAAGDCVNVKMVRDREVEVVNVYFSLK